MVWLTVPQVLLALVFLIASMLSVGMQTGIADLRSLVESRSLLLRSLMANFVFVPLVGIALAHLLPLPLGAAGALVLLACTPGGLSAIQFTSRVRGEATLAGAILLLSGVLAVLVSPAMIRVASPASVDLSLPYGRVLGFVALAMLLPLGIGLFVRSGAQGAALKLAKPMSLLALVAFVAFMVATGSLRKEAVGSIGAPAVGAMALFFVASMVIGWLMGGPASESRQVLATATSMRNAALCLVVAQVSPWGDAVMTPLIAFSLLMVPPNMLYSVFNLVRAKRRARPAVASGQLPGGPGAAGRGLDP